MRNFIRTSHDQRRRSSAAATAEQLAYIAALNEQRQTLPAVDGVKLAAADIRRSSMSGDPPKGSMGQLLAGGGIAGVAGAQDRRRGSLTGAAASAAALGVGGGGVGIGSVLTAPLLQASPRRRWNANKTPLNKIDMCNMEIKQTSVWAIVVIVCAGCSAVVLLAYVIKSYL